MDICLILTKSTTIIKVLGNRLKKLQQVSQQEKMQFESQPRLLKSRRKSKRRGQVNKPVTTIQ